ncbi:MAG TPA: signal peptidase II [Solirubrobacteraceae bacterium]|nr:signal peptidase II [Solirubrobacteraceae bacterium]
MASAQAGAGEARPQRDGRAWLYAVAVAAAVIAADQLAKAAVRSSITPGEERRFLPGIELVNTRNHGVAFGLNVGGAAGVTVLIGLALVILLAYFARHLREPLIWLPTGMLIGGAVGNVLDRLRAGSVTDFVKLPLGWPPFNLADAAITFGILALYLVIERGRARERADRDDRDGGEPAAKPRGGEPGGGAPR